MDRSDISTEKRFTRSFSQNKSSLSLRFGQNGDKVVTVEQRNDPRESECAFYGHKRHRWSTSFKDVISKACYVQVLRCRYCAKFVAVQFDRVVLPSGRVTVNETVTAIVAADKDPEVTWKLRGQGASPFETKRTDNAGTLESSEASPLHAQHAQDDSNEVAVTK